MAGAILSANAELSRWSSEPRQASAVSIRGKKGCFDLDEAARETELHSTATDGSLTPQIKRGIAERWWARMGEGLQSGSV